jgi:hypothetical protein
LESAYQAYLKGRDLSRKQLKEALRDSVMQYSGPNMMEKTRLILDEVVEEAEEINEEQNQNYLYMVDLAEEVGQIDILIDELESDSKEVKKPSIKPNFGLGIVFLMSLLCAGILGLMYFDPINTYFKVKMTEEETYNVHSTFSE